MKPPDVVLNEAIELIEQIREVASRAYAKTAGSIYANHETQLLCVTLAEEYKQIALACDRWIKTGNADAIVIQPCHTECITESK